MTRKNALLCKLNGSCNCYCPTKPLKIQPSVTILGGKLGVTSIVKDRMIAEGSEAWRFLCGERIRLEHGRMCFCFSEPYLQYLNIDVKELENGDSQSAIKRFLDERFELFVQGVECLIDNDVHLGMAMAYVEPNSWSIISSKNCGKNEVLWVVKVDYGATVVMKDPLTPRALSSFSEGVHIVDRSRDKVEARNAMESVLGICGHYDDLYISCEGDFAMVKPKDVQELKSVLQSEYLQRRFSFCDFVQMAAAAAHEPNLMEKLQKYQGDESLIPTQPAIGPQSMGMFAGSMRYGGYSYAPRVYVDIASAFSRNDFVKSLSIFNEKLKNVFEDCKTAFCKAVDDYEVNRYVDYFHYSVEYAGFQIWFGMDRLDVLQNKEDVVLKFFKDAAVQVTDFCSALSTFFERYLDNFNALADIVEIDDLRIRKKLFDLAWSRVELDPVFFYGWQNSTVSNMARALLS